MSVSEEYIEYVIDQLTGFGAVTSRRMFGGAGLYHNGVMFALIADDTLYFRVDDTNRSDYEDAGSGPFLPYPGKSSVMPYYEVPVDIIETRDMLARWAEDAAGAALRSSRKKRR